MRRNRRDERPLLITALTGGIATGKSVVARFLAERGCYIHSADRAAHELMIPGNPGWAPVVRRFGRGILRDDGTIDRKKLGEIVFSDSQARDDLNRIVHPLVTNLKQDLIRRLRGEGRVKIFVSEAALTIEAGFSEAFDKIIVVFCRRDIQVRRLMDRDGLNRKEALRRIEAQMPTREKKKFADYLIDTSGSLARTEEQTGRLWALLLKDFEGKCGRGNAPRGRGGPKA